MLLSDKNIFITGGLNGIGLSIVNKLASLEASVHIVDKDDNDSENKISEIKQSSHNNNIYFYKVDITNTEKVKEIVNRISSINVLINNAAILRFDSIEKYDEQNYNDVFEVNFFAMVKITNVLLEKLSFSDHSKIINISSINGLFGTENTLFYNASKAAIINFTKSLAVELGPKKINVNCIAPGMIKTAMSITASGKNEFDEDLFKDVYIKYKKIPLRKYGSPKDIAGPVAFLCSEDSNYITGQVISVDGGITSTF